MYPNYVSNIFIVSKLKISIMPDNYLKHKKLYTIVLEIKEL